MVAFTMMELVEGIVESSIRQAGIDSIEVQKTRDSFLSSLAVLHDEIEMKSEQKNKGVII